jgi:folate-binding Fe-S cluster repair protein YgfZ
LTEPAGHDLLRTGAALVTHADRGCVRVTGVERASWLQGLLSNDIEALAAGQGCYAAWLTPQGRMLTDAVVLAEDDALTIDLPAPLVDTLLRQLNAAIFAEDVVLADESAQWRTLGVHGARAAEVVARSLTGSRPSNVALTADHLATWQEYTHAPFGPSGRLIGASTYGVPGFRMRVLTADADLWMSRLRLAGATLAPADELEFARIESGRPQFLVDMDADTIPLEAGIEDRAISVHQGLLRGPEVIVRIVHHGGARVVPSSWASPSMELRAGGAGWRSRKVVGRVTSAAVAAPGRHRGARLRARDSATSTAVRVACDGGEVRHRAGVSAL